MRLEKSRQCRVPLAVPPAAAAQLQAFLSRPLRPLRGLLDPARLQADGTDQYLYQSRPYGVAGWTLQPRVRLRTTWDGQTLLIEQLEARVEGLGPWQDRLRFGLEARLRPHCPPSSDGQDPPAGPAALLAEARVWTDLPAGAAPVAAPVIQLAFEQLLERLERRCQRGLRRRAESWLDRNP